VPTSAPTFVGESAAIWIHEKGLPVTLPGRGEPWWGRLRWVRKMPDQWSPKVSMTGGRVTVELYTYRPCTAVSEGVWLHRDTYAAGGYEPLVRDVLVAEGLPATICY
jgi:hypothetical protein